METSDWVRLALLLGLGLLSARFVGWLGNTVVAAVLALLFHLQEGATWPGSVLAALAVAYLLPRLQMLTSIPGTLVTLGAVVVIGVPSLLVSHYWCESSWTLACADAFGLALLVPASIIHCLFWMGVIEPPAETAEKVSSYTPWPTYCGPSSSDSSYYSETHGGGASSPITQERRF